MIDNGAFSFWTTGKSVNWDGYYRWVEPWLDYQTTWAVIPDVIDGTEEENDKLIQEWPFGERGAPVWHLHESLDRLIYLINLFPRVCFGSSGEYREVGSSRWHHRMVEVFNDICPGGTNPCWLHMLRGMSLSGGPYPFSSVDSTDVARNHNRKQNTVVSLAERWDGIQCPVRWVKQMEQQDAFTA